MEILFQIVILIVSAYISAALAPDPPKPEAATLDQFRLPHTRQGETIIKVFGTELIESPALGWYGDLEPKAIRKKGGKK